MEQKLTFEDALFALGLSRDLMNEKTKEIQELRKRIEILLKSLKPFAEQADIYFEDSEKHDDEGNIIVRRWINTNVSEEHLLNAKRVYKEETK